MEPWLRLNSQREQLFLEAGRRIVALAKSHYEEDNYEVLPRSIANFDAFENAMTLDISMGGSTNTVLHLLAAASEGEVKFAMEDIDRLSRKVPNLCKVAPATPEYHVEDVHRAGGVMAILGELDRAGLINRHAKTVHASNMQEAIEQWDVSLTKDPARKRLFPCSTGWCTHPNCIQPEQTL